MTCPVESLDGAGWPIIPLVSLAFLVAACIPIGPNSVKSDQLDYADAISEAGKRFRLTVAVIEVMGETLVPQVLNGERFILTVLGADRPGSIHGIAGCLASHGVNIVDLHARVDGERFSLVMEAFLPADLSPGVVRAELERFGRDLGLDVFVQHENIFLATSEPSPVRVAVPNPRGDAVVPH